MKTILATVAALGLTLGMTFTASAQQFNINVNSTTIVGNNNSVNNINQGGSGSVFNNTSIHGHGNQVNNINSGGGYYPQPGYQPAPHYPARPTCGTGGYIPRPTCGTGGYGPRPCGGVVSQYPPMQYAPRGPVSNFTQIHGNFNSVNNFNH